MSFELKYNQKVLDEDIPRLNGAWKKRIRSTLEQKLTTEPVLYGKPLRGDLSGCFKLRIGNYRTIYQIKKTVVYIIAIQHRSAVYKNNIERRL